MYDCSTWGGYSETPFFVLDQQWENPNVLHCLPQSMVFPDSAATGALMGPGKLDKFASEAGFREMDILPVENPFWRFYRLTS